MTKKRIGDDNKWRSTKSTQRGQENCAAIPWPGFHYFYRQLLYIYQCHFSTACTLMVSSLREFHTTLSSRLIGGNSYHKAGHVVVTDTEKRLNRNLNYAPLKMPKPRFIPNGSNHCTYSCAVCKIHMCTVPCFVRYHYLENFAYDDPNRVHKNKTRKHLKLM